MGLQQTTLVVAICEKPPKPNSGGQPLHVADALSFLAASVGSPQVVPEVYS